jgi:hypothetical protein
MRTFNNQIVHLMMLFLINLTEAKYNERIAKSGRYVIETVWWR